MAQPRMTNTFSVFITKIIRKTCSVQMNSFLFKLLACLRYKTELLSVLKTNVCYGSKNEYVFRFD